ncbi:peptidylprolyl isomerase [bacterium]|nr:peptidylprolyl isomerase [bacterium]|tara:strand:- start:457 stop:1074 length:618 start_codon:yes stop_codon:yes gene_type:complete
MGNKLLIIIGIVALIGVVYIFLFMNKDTEEPIDVENSNSNPIVTLKTTKGDIEIELFMDTMPVTAGNFLKLAQEGFYNEVKFHRVISNFMIQGGDPLSKGDNTALYGTGGPGYAIEDEFVTGVSNVRGTISMANSGPNTGGSQFFINLIDNTNLDFDKEPLTSKHPVFGKVVDGMDIVDVIGGVETGARDIPTTPVVIETIEVKE